MSLLKTESVFTCTVRFHRWVEKYNRVHKLKDQFGCERTELVRERIFPCWLIYSISKRVPVEFPVIRNDDHSIDIEEVCRFLYPALKSEVNNKWLAHSCFKCSSRVVVLDGNAKLYRTVCAFRGEKHVEKGKLNEFSACSATPLTSKAYCKDHLNNKDDVEVWSLNNLCFDGLAYFESSWFDLTQ